MANGGNRNDYDESIYPITSKITTTRFLLWGIAARVLFIVCGTYPFGDQKPSNYQQDQAPEQSPVNDPGKSGGALLGTGQDFGQAGDGSAQPLHIGGSGMVGFGHSLIWNGAILRGVLN